MKGFLNPDGAVYQAMSTVAQLVTVSVMCILCCLPVVTAGAAFAAAARVCQNMVRQETDATAKAFLRAFRENVRQGTASWLIQMLLLVMPVMGLHMASGSPEGGGKAVLLMAAVLALVFCVATPAIAYQLMARYSNTLAAHWKNAFALTVAQFPRALVMAALGLAPVAMAFCAPAALFYTLPVWIFLMPGCTAWSTARLLNPVFRILEGE